MTNIYHKKHFFNRLQLLACLFLLMAFLAPQLRAQIAPSDFVYTTRSLERTIFVNVAGGFDAYIESIPAGFSANYTDRQGFSSFSVPTYAGTYRVALRPKAVGATPPLNQIIFGEDFSVAILVLTIEQWGTAHWSSMYRSFAYCGDLSAISASDVPDLSGVSDMTEAFYACESLTSAPQMNNWDVSNVTNMFRTFMWALAFNLPLDKWDVSNVTNFAGTFYNAEAFNQPLNSWNVSGALDMNSMFVNAASFNQPLNNWDVSNALGLHYMFYGAAAFNQPLDDWDVGNATNMNNMFDGATAFNQNLGKWKLNPALVASDMLTNSGMDCNSYSNTLIGWANNATTPSEIALGATGKTFGPGAVPSRDYLINTKSWTINGDSFDANCVVLPVTLVSFDASQQESTSLLSWSTTEETNSDRFEIQRSQDAHHWEAIGMLASSGESKTLKNYRFSDQYPLDGINYYRLKMVDRDKTFAYSRIRSVAFNSKARLAVYPNPATDRLLISDYKNVAKVTLYNAAGVKVFENNKIAEQGVNVAKLPPGVYTAEITFRNGSTGVRKVLINNH